jgi:LPXTG-motif cell wall-anchored protein
MRRLLSVGLLAMGIMGLVLGKNQGGQAVQGQNHSNQRAFQAPEINPTQAVSALALLSGGLLVIRRKKNS